MEYLQYSLKKLANKLSVPFLLIFRSSFNKKAIPNEWKQANVVPIFKGKSSKHIINNYRSISLKVNCNHSNIRESCY